MTNGNQNRPPTLEDVLAVRNDDHHYLEKLALLSGWAEQYLTNPMIRGLSVIPNLFKDLNLSETLGSSTPKQIFTESKLCDHLNSPDNAYRRWKLRIYTPGPREAYMMEHSEVLSMILDELA